jgi:hypothetical protein|tara:strand:+ start:3838 stop:4212 length:375 start_codon:yes stop_codon:yes gene_type:complete
MNQLNDFYKIIQNKYVDNTINNDSIYDKIVTKEKDAYETINRVIDFKNQQKKEKTLFINTKFSDIFMNIFKVLNGLLEDLTKFDKITYKQLKKLVNKKQRIIYLGLFMILCAIFLALIEISDNI